MMQGTWQQCSAEAWECTREAAEQEIRMLGIFAKHMGGQES
jgi:hypothetical protein